VARQHGTPDWGVEKGGSSPELQALRRCAVGGRGTAAGVASGGDGRRLVVREGGTRQRGAHGGDRELGGGPGVALRGGSTVVEQGSAVGAMGGRKKGCSRWGVGLPL
jgi:hypothetical protein